MAVDALASQPHYAAHIAPIWWALPPEHRGHFYAIGALADYGDSEGLPGWQVGHPPHHHHRPTIIAGAADELAIPGREAVYLEHGAGQTYPGDPAAADNPSYSGSPGHDQVRLFLCPGETVAGRWRARYPDTPAVAVGCPRLDGWHRRIRQTGWRPTVAITFHSEAHLCNETRSAWAHYRDGMAAAVAELHEAGWHTIGHAHPRLWDRLHGWWHKVGAEPVRSIDEVFARAHVLCVDNTSAGPEAASIGIPLVWMNAPWYRKDVHHGGRFWDWPTGQIQTETVEELPTAVRIAHQDPPTAARSRQEMVEAVYVATDGRAALRAVEAITAAFSTRV